MDDATDTTSEDGSAQEHGGRELVVRSALLLGVAALVVAAVLLLPVLRPVRERFEHVRPGWAVAAFALQLASVLSFVAAFRGAFERRIGWRASSDLALVEEGANVVLPSGGSGGVALGAVLLARTGVPTPYATRHSAVLFLVTSAVSIVALVVAGLAQATGLLPGHASLTGTLLPAAAGLAILLAAVWLPRHVPPVQAAPGQRLRGKVRQLQRFLDDATTLSIQIIRSGDVLLIGGSVGYFAFDVASLAAAFQALGHGALPAGTLTLAYVLGHAGAMVPVPGSAEGGLVGAFSAYGSPVSLTVGAVLVYRTFHAGVPVALSLFGYADLRRLRRDAPPPEQVAERFDGTPA